MCLLVRLIYALIRFIFIGNSVVLACFQSKLFKSTFCLKKMYYETSQMHVFCSLRYLFDDIAGLRDIRTRNFYTKQPYRKTRRNGEICSRLLEITEFEIARFDCIALSGASQQTFFKNVPV